MTTCKKENCIRSKGTRNDYEVVERFVELLHEGFDSIVGRNVAEQIEFEAIEKEIGYAAYAAREIYHLLALFILIGMVAYFAFMLA